MDFGPGENLERFSKEVRNYFDKEWPVQFLHLLALPFMNTGETKILETKAGETGGNLSPLTF